MIIEKKIQRTIEGIAENIELDIDLIDSMGVIIASSQKDRIHQMDPYTQEEEWDEDESIQVVNDRTYVKIEGEKGQNHYIALNGSAPEIKNYGCLLGNLIRSYFDSSVHKMDRDELFQRFFLGQINEMEFRGYARDYKIELKKKRCVMVLQASKIDAEQVYTILMKAFPRNKGDILVVMNSRTMVLIKVLDEETEADELLQLANAINDTLQSELSVKAHIGIGGKKEELVKVRESYLEAQEAIEVGRVQDESNPVYLYDHLLLERFLYSIPREVGERFYHMVFHEDYSKLLNDEIIATIEKFFENSLNLSETSRQLYIHRNTLVYRLDKILKGTGLDLRNFDDAVTFKIMMMLGRYLSDKKQRF